MAMEVIRDGFVLCADCMIVAVNGDYSSLDYYYGHGESPGRGELRPGAKERAERIDAGLKALGPNLVTSFDSETGEGYDEFSSYPCECCGTTLAGARYDFAVLGEVEAKPSAPNPNFDAKSSVSTECDECGESIPDDEPSMINTHHDSSCSLHPGNSVG